MKVQSVFKKFLHQLKLLLWKNFITKKRKLVVFIFELTVPLVLFLIMFAIRTKQKAKPVDTVYFNAWPLPSAGFIPLMQSFCRPEHGVRNENGFIEYPNSTARQMLMKVDQMLKSNYFKNLFESDNSSSNSEMIIDRNKTEPNFVDSKHNEAFNARSCDWTGEGIQKWICKLAQRDLNNMDKSETKEFISEMEQALEDLSQLSAYFPTGQCTSKNPDKIIEEASQKKSPHRPESILTMNSESKDQKLKDTFNKNRGFGALWFAMQDTFCGPTEHVDSNQTDSSFDSLNLSFEQTRSLSIIFDVIYNNPVILYSPNSSLITDKLIKKANQTFELIDKINKFSRDWLNNSQSLRLLIKNQTQNVTDNVYIKSKNEKLMDQIDTIDSAACSWLWLMSGANLNIFKGFNDEEDLVEYFLNQAYFDNVTVIASLVFDVKNTSAKLDPFIKYKIRQNASFTYTTKKIRERYWYPSPRDWDYYYYLFGFVWLQDLIDRAIIDYHSNRTVLEPGSFLNQMPYPCYMIDNFLKMIQHVMPLCLAISFVYTVSMLTQTIVHEKEMRLREVMKIMGLNNTVHLIAWFITYFLQFTLIMAVVTGLLHYGKILSHSDPLLIFFLLEIFATATICFSFLVSSLYSKAKLAAASAGILYFLSYVPCMYITIREDVALEIIPSWAKDLACLLSTSAFGISSKYIAFFENDGAGLQWHNLNKSPLENDNYNCLNCIIIMTIDCVVYLILAWYIENVNPSYGIPLPWYYPLKLNFWTGKQEFIYKQKEPIWQRVKNHFRKDKLSYVEFDQDKLINASSENNGKRSKRNDLFEAEPNGLNIGVSIRNLFKKFGTSKLAVDNLSLNFYENQITSFLGHNGAGKTTTMSILTGLLPATSGTAFIYDKDIRTDINEIRKNLGFCPQHNVLFDNLTVEEHLWFYAKIKFINDAAINELIENFLVDTDLAKKRKNLVHTLSGGMQRKLSVAISFVGDANLVILDEPTAGVDPHARRAIWDLLLKYKQGRTIILSTHHMDEAELLGDRIAIISNGELQCCGTSLFLKNALGEGNNLTLVKDCELINQDLDIYQEELRKSGPESPIIRSLQNLAEISLITSESIAYLLQDKYINEILSVIKRFVPSAFLKNVTLREYQFVLPLHERSNPRYWDLFKELEKNLVRLRIKCYGVHDVSLEEIFVKAVELKASSKKNDQSDEEKSPVDLSLYNIDYIYSDLETGYRAYFKQVKSLVIKKYLYNKRNWKSLLTQIILPACFVSIAMTVALSAPGFLDLPPLELSPAQFYPLTKPDGIYIPFSHNPNMTSEFGTKSASSTDIVQSFYNIVGIGSTCTLNQKNLSFSDIINRNYENSGSVFNQSYFGNTKYCQLVFNKNSDIDMKNFPITNITFRSKVSKKKFNSYTPKCQCMEDNSGFVCSQGFEIPPSFKTITHETLLNISGENETDYYLSTTDMYRLKRYGGLGFDKDRILDNYQDSSEHVQNLDKQRVARIWYNNKGFHAMPVFLNVLNNAILRANVRKNFNQSDANFRPNEYGITVINHPMNQTNNYLSTEYLLQGSDVLISIFTIVAMSFVNASFVLFLVYERSIKSLHLQFLMGLNPFLYWVTNFIWDMINYMLPASCVIIIFKIFDVPAYVHGSNYTAVILLFLFYGWSVSPLMYPMTFIFKEPSSAYIFLIVINLFTGITCVESSFLLQVFSFDSQLKFVFDFVKVAFLIFPPYCLGRGLIDIAYNDYYNTFYTKTGQISKIKSPFEWEITTRNLVAMACIGFISWIFTLLLEYEFFKFKWIKWNNKEQEKLVYTSKNEDSDVKSERLRVENGRVNNDQLILKSLRKAYSKLTDYSSNFFFKKKNKFIAVKNISFGIPEGECFGLLGVNGAGKTTTFKMLTADLSPSSGEILIRGSANFLNALVNKKLFWSKIGYCPQFDALYDELTPNEHIRLFARIKGVKTKYENILSSSLLERLDLVQYGNRPVGELSLGNKRKLSTAIALVGNPSILFLDEPTSGQDPVARRKLWQEILNLTRIKKKSVLLTSHSMEECESLCTRLAIMVDGSFRCIGSVQHLKTKFGDGYTLTVKLKEMPNYLANISNESGKDQGTSSKSDYFGPVNNKYVCMILKELKENIDPYCKLKERNFNNVYQFELRTPESESYDIGNIYRIIELNKLKFNICDYSLSQNTLDNVFINFVREQTLKKEELVDDSEEEIENRRCNKKFFNTEMIKLADDVLIDDISDNLIDFDSFCSSKLVLNQSSLDSSAMLKNSSCKDLLGSILNDDVSSV
uniref:ATP-binding cassette transporter subfamily A member 2 n=1 Tax=Brachionus rotundiformis TaxID=96890 RepID=A0A7H9SL27_9BILA|nr:ATP-binding cassette transporter subfamily A member 2 [Brachionus rotundiformis]